MEIRSVRSFGMLDIFVWILLVEEITFPFEWSYKLMES